MDRRHNTHNSMITTTESLQQLKRGLIHFAHPIDGDLCLCGKVCTRTNPISTTGDNVDCLECVQHEEAGTCADV